MSIQVVLSGPRVVAGKSQEKKSSLLILRLDSAGESPEVIFEHENLETERGLFWSPDDRQLVFSMRVREEVSGGVRNFVESRLFIINRDGSGLRQLTRGMPK